ncbi:hypothetical protein CAP48_16455 [Advenella sp. S44]|nr:hypothetical protein CAP48_16455 [Advenella sp. S44]
MLLADNEALIKWCSYFESILIHEMPKIIIYMIIKSRISLLRCGENDIYWNNVAEGTWQIHAPSLVIVGLWTSMNLFGIGYGRYCANGKSAC